MTGLENIVAQIHCRCRKNVEREWIWDSGPLLPARIGSHPNFATEQDAERDLFSIVRWENYKHKNVRWSNFQVFESFFFILQNCNICLIKKECPKPFVSPVYCLASSFTLVWQKIALSCNSSGMNLSEYMKAKVNLIRCSKLASSGRVVILVQQHRTKSR